ncbi:hypothetical protein DVT68_19920 [Dyella solisilvae]|uniref:Uncharacterized protein n=1 Tax=Dyella solisilvae TaxID=1920168 RepID=A0A370K2E2_9GAMM|nr:hypothetical protein [Dyella solisilvae]RDI96823.1 hypothetical protein DVT68_19920 [Dyella solisilvae]
MEALFYLCSVAARAAQERDGRGRNVFNGCLPVGLLLAVVLTSVLRLFETYVYDVGRTLEACCSIGPINPKNPLSSKAVAFTYVVLPIAVAMTLIFARVARKHLDRIEAEYRGSKVACLIFIFGVVMLAPLGAQGSGLQPLAVLAGQAAAYGAFALWVRFQRIHGADLAGHG